jgi:hypothetical protein
MLKFILANKCLLIEQNINKNRENTVISIEILLNPTNADKMNTPHVVNKFPIISANDILIQKFLEKLKEFSMNSPKNIERQIKMITNILF